jgi:hypothetical protein
MAAPVTRILYMDANFHAILCGQAKGGQTDVLVPVAEVLCIKLDPVSMHQVRSGESELYAHNSHCGC